ncbi:MAG: hypothetical protein ACRD51_13255, partial [Candidatus Acidiferrum sp.]
MNARMPGSMVDHLLSLAGHLVGPVMRRIYSPQRIQQRIIRLIPDHGPVVYISRHQTALTLLQIKIRNGLPFALKFESVSLQISLDALAELGRINYQKRFEVKGG